MSQFTFAIVFKILCLLVGLIAIYLGYRLFMKGYLEKQGEVEAGKGDIKIKMSQVAPGIYFSEFGTFIILLAIFKGVSFTSTFPNSTARPAATTRSDRDSNLEIHFNLDTMSNK